MLLLIISFIAGILTILAPCVLPALPIIIGGSLGGDISKKTRPYIIGASLALSIIGFTLLLKVSTVLIGLPPEVLNWISGGLLIALGIVAAMPMWWEALVIHFNWQAKSDQQLAKSERVRGFIGPVLIGMALGPVFASCSPTYAFILASILPRSFLAGLIYLASYTIGLALALLVVALAGRKFISRFGWAINTHSLFRRLLGVLFILIGIVVITGFQVKVETWVADHLPFDEGAIEQVLLAKQHQNPLIKNLIQSATSSSVLNVSPTPAPKLVGLTNWINSPPLTLAGLKGKVVLVDFWTYSCINCIRSIPYVEKWYDTYAKDGFVVIGVSTPEFAFEHVPSNVAAAVKTDGITYPVALDNNDDTWNAYDNDTWPADYLIDQSGNIRYVSLGEGGYNTTEQAIQELLGVKQPLQEGNVTVPVGATQTPETYFGTDRESGYEGTPNVADVSGSTVSFIPVKTLNQDSWTLGGSWDIENQYITSESNSSTLTFKVNAKNVYMVASPSPTTSQTGTVTVSLPSDNAKQFGSDAPNGLAVVASSKLYNIVSMPSVGSTTVTLTVPAGVTLYTFTFGS